MTSLQLTRRALAERESGCKRVRINPFDLKSTKLHVKASGLILEANIVTASSATQIRISTSDARPGEAGVATQERLIHVAMALFGERGIDRVSLKEISDAAGNRNKSAVGYHFASKQGLIGVLLQRIDQEVGRALGESLNEIAARLDSGEPVSIADFVEDVLQPVITFYMTSPYGRDAFRLLARLMHDPIEGLPHAVRRENGIRIKNALDILRRIQPDKAPRLTEQHVHHIIMTTINGFSLADRYLAIRTDRWAADELATFFESYAAFLTGGLSSGADQMKTGKD